MSSGFLGGGGVGPTAIRRRSGLAAPVPVAGNNVIVNGDFASDVGWNLDSDVGIADGVVTWTGAGAARAVYRGASSVGVWLQTVFDLVSRTAGTFGPELGSNTAIAKTATPATAILNIGRITGNTTIALKSASSGAGVCDNFFGYPLTLSSLFSTALYASANCDLSVAVTRTAGTQAGFVARLDSASSPANFIIAYLDGASNVKVDKCVAGVYTNVISGAVTYGSTKILRLVCSGNSVSAYYDGTQVGSTVTVSDAGIVSNTRHGLFSTYASNSFAGYVAA